MRRWLPSAFSLLEASDFIGFGGSDRSADLALLLQALQMLVELLAGDDVHLEEHARVIQAAQLRAAPGEGALARRGEVEGVDATGHDVELEVELRDPEGVDDVRRLQCEA